MLYFGIAVVVAAIAFFSFKAVKSGKTFMKAALYHHFMDHREVILEVHGQDAPVPSIAYSMAVQKFQNISDGGDDSNFCFEVLSHQSKTFGGRKAMLQTARQRHFPE